jgi:hypothetical protein
MAHILPQRGGDAQGRCAPPTVRLHWLERLGHNGDTDDRHQAQVAWGHGPRGSGLDVMPTDAVVDQGSARRFAEPVSAANAAGLHRHTG